MNKRQVNRLLNVARALREAPIPEAFDMRAYLHTASSETSTNEHWCGTPSCALGHYGSRTDLQRLMHVGITNASWTDRPTPALLYGNNKTVEFNTRTVREHFGITEDQAHDLFSMIGCDRAKTAQDAAKFIENFVLENYQER